MAASRQPPHGVSSVRDPELSNSTRISASAASVFAFQMGLAKSVRWGRQLVRRSGGVELQAARGQMAVCGMIIALMRVATSFAVALWSCSWCDRPARIPTHLLARYLHPTHVRMSLTDV